MGRSARTVVAGVPHHVVLRGNNRRKIFSYDYERIAFLRLMSEARPKCLVHAFSLLSNHIHLVLVPKKETDMAKFVKQFAQRYAQMRNRRTKSSGKLFDDRYWSSVIDSKEYMSVVTAYIDDNPRAAGLSEEYVAKWSSASAHTGIGQLSSVASELWSPSDWYLSLGEAPSIRQRQYREWLKVYQDHSSWKKLTASVPNRYPITDIRRPDSSRAA